MPARSEPAAVDESPATDAFVDPKDWVGEFVVSETGVAERPARSNGAPQEEPRAAADNLTELADPSEDACSPAHPDSSQPAERRIGIGRVEDEHSSQPGVDQEGRKSFGRNVVGQADGQDDVVEAVERGRRVRGYVAAGGMDDQVMRGDPGGLEKRGEKRGLILAVSVSVRQDARGRMGPEASDADLDGHVADLPLDEPGQSPEPGERVRRSRRQLDGLGGHGGVRGAHGPGQSFVPGPDVRPARKTAAVRSGTGSR